MNIIYDIFKKLNNQEIRSLKQQMEHAVFEYEKVGKLFELITRYPEQPESFYSEKIYDKEPDNTFRVTKARLKRMLENVILNDKSLMGYSTEIINHQLQVKKKLLQSEILIGRGAYKAGRNLLLQCLATARKYELYQELFQGELLMYRLTSIRATTDEYEISSKNLQMLNEKSGYINEALILHYYTTNLLLHKTLTPQEMETVWLKIKRIIEISELVSHPLVEHAHYLSEVYYLQIKGDFVMAAVFCEKFIQLIKKNPIYYSAQRLGGALIQQAQVSLQLGEVKHAAEVAQSALKIFNVDEMNYLVTLELMFRIAFYSKDYTLAASYIEKAMTHSQFEASKTIAAQWHYFSACVAFKTKDYKQAARHLLLTAPLLADKFGRNLHIRLLEIMITYETGAFDLLDTRIQNLKQFINRAAKQTGMIRMQYLYKIMMLWSRAGYDFTHLHKGIYALMEQLEDYHQNDPFRTTDFELIRFEQWMEGKMK